MTTPPPTRADGYRWVSHILTRSDRVRVCVRAVPSDALYDLAVRDIAAMGWPFDSEVEIWSHPDDTSRISSIVATFLDRP